MYKKDHQVIWKTYFFQISIAVLFCIIGIFVGMSIRNRNLIEDIILARAKSHFSSIVLTRRWNADYGGVFVEKKSGVVSNPYLVNPDIQATDGRIFTKRNPALMTREISEYAKKDGSMMFHITSLKPLNPDNKADEFETRSLQAFEKDTLETTEKEHRDGKTFLRYMAPLKAEASCLTCHEKQGYKIGDIRGGISVTFDMTDVEKETRFHTYIIILLGGLTISLLLGILYSFTFQLMKKLKESLKIIEEMAVKDDLSGLYNRRYFFERLKEEFDRAKRYQHPLGCLMMDIDYFKKINDTYGHQVGDQVIRKISKVLQNSSRSTDTLARYGGEEFIKLMPETGLEGTLQDAEKIRSEIEALEIIVSEGVMLKITISIGIVAYSAEELSKKAVDVLINDADKALYKAKMLGRNRVEISDPSTDA